LKFPPNKCVFSVTVYYVGPYNHDMVRPRFAEGNGLQM